MEEKRKDTEKNIIQVISSTESALIYCSTKRECEEVNALIESKGISSQPYHAELSKALKESLQKKWTKEEIKVLCYTTAFGMGINKPNVKVLMFHSLPSCMEDLFQAWGRAGRDGLPAKCYLYFSFEDRVFHVRNIFDQHNFDSQRQTSSLLRFQRVLDFVMSKECRRKKLITYFNPEEAGLALCDDCDICKDSVANTPLTNGYTPQITSIIEFLQVVERPITIKYLAQVASGKMNNKIRENRDEHSSIFQFSSVLLMHVNFSCDTL